jgi:hypothetical protein
MAYTIDPDTMLFRGLTLKTADDLYNLCKAIVVQGEIPLPRENVMLEDWLEMSGLNPAQRIINISIAFPQKALMSLSQFHRHYVPTACPACGHIPDD